MIKDQDHDLYQGKMVMIKRSSSLKNWKWSWSFDHDHRKIIYDHDQLDHDHWQRSIKDQINISNNYNKTY